MYFHQCSKKLTRCNCINLSIDLFPGLKAFSIRPMRIRHSSHQIATQSSHSVDRAEWQAKMASIELDTVM